MYGKMYTLISLPVCSAKTRAGFLAVSGIDVSNVLISNVSSSENPLLSSPEESCFVFYCNMITVLREK